MGLGDVGSPQGSQQLSPSPFVKEDLEGGNGSVVKKKRKFKFKISKALSPAQLRAVKKWGKFSADDMATIKRRLKDPEEAPELEARLKRKLKEERERKKRERREAERLGIRYPTVEPEKPPRKRWDKHHVADTARTHTGHKITRMGKDRKEKVRQILSDGIRNDLSHKEIAHQLSLHADTPKGKDSERNWLRIARTEVNNARGHSSLQFLRQAYGPDAIVYRDTYDCCPCAECEAAFGPPGKPRKFKVKSVPVQYIGALHPWCRCSPWKLMSSGRVKKSEDECHPVGLIRKKMIDGNYYAELWDGNQWLDPYSETARTLIRYLIHHTPLVLTGRKDGYTMGHQGYGNAKVFSLVDPGKLESVSFFPKNPLTFQDGERRFELMKTRHSFLEYLEDMVSILPFLFQQPEYWEEEHADQKEFSDFFGYVTFSDWTCLIPGFPNQDAVIGTYHSEVILPRNAVKYFMKKLMETSIHRERLR